MSCLRSPLVIRFPWFLSTWHGPCWPGQHLSWYGSLNHDCTQIQVLADSTNADFQKAQLDTWHTPWLGFESLVFYIKVSGVNHYIYIFHKHKYADNKVGYTLDKSPVHHRGHIEMNKHSYFTPMANFRVTNQPTHGFFYFIIIIFFPLLVCLYA